MQSAALPHLHGKSWRLALMRRGVIVSSTKRHVGDLRAFSREPENSLARPNQVAALDVIEHLRPQRIALYRQAGLAAEGENAVKIRFALAPDSAQHLLPPLRQRPLPSCGRLLSSVSAASRRGHFPHGGAGTLQCIEFDPRVVQIALRAGKLVARLGNQFIQRMRRRVHGGHYTKRYAKRNDLYPALRLTPLAYNAPVSEV